VNKGLGGDIRASFLMEFYMGINTLSFLYRLFRAILPPIIFRPIVNFFDKNKAQLFDGADNAVLFKKLIATCDIYAEYGCGLSTQYVLDNSAIPVESIDSSNEWVEIVKTRSKNSKRLHIHYANVGVVGDWGRPISYQKRSNFQEYTDWIWEQNITPDTVLIDGRFRVACFLTCLLKAPKGTKIIFDDYTNRPEYHLVEEFLPVRETCGRQALFIIDTSIEAQDIEISNLLEKFRYVMD